MKKEGVPASELNKDQKALLTALIQEYLRRDRPEIAAAEMARVEKEGVQHIRDFMTNYREFNDLDEAAAVIHRFNPRRSLDVIRKFTCVYNLKQLPNGKWGWKYDTYFSQGHARPVDIKQMHDELAADVKKIKCPTLLVKGGESDVFSLDGAREFQELIPGSEFALVPKAGHSVMGDNPAGFEAAVRTFYTKKGYLSA